MEWEFFDLVNDPKEMHNVYNDPAYLDALRELKAELRRLQDELGDDRTIRAITLAPDYISRGTALILLKIETTGTPRVNAHNGLFLRRARFCERISNGRAVKELKRAIRTLIHIYTFELIIDMR